MPKRSQDLPSLAQLRAFEAVVRYAGIRRGARALGLHHGVVGRHLRDLEDWAGVRLINRLAGGFELTMEGQRFNDRISRALEEIRGSRADLREDPTDRRLQIWCVPGLAHKWLASRLLEFQQLAAEVELELHPTESNPDFARYEADVDIRYVPASVSTVKAAVLGGVRRLEIARPEVFPVAAPALADSLRLASAKELLKATLLHEDGDGQWREWFTAHEVTSPKTLRGHRLWHAPVALEAARAGQGVALANAFLCREDLAAGRLVMVKPGGEPKPVVILGAYVFFARADQWSVPTIVHFRRWLIRSMKRELPRANLAAFPIDTGTRQDSHPERGLERNRLRVTRSRSARSYGRSAR